MPSTAFRFLVLAAAFIISPSLADADSYERISAHVGCHTDSGESLSYIGRPSDFLPNTEECTDGDTAECVSLGKKACDQLASEETVIAGVSLSVRGGAFKSTTPRPATQASVLAHSA